MNTFGEYGTMTNEIKEINTLKILGEYLAETHHLTAKNVYKAGVLNYHPQTQEDTHDVPTPARRLMAARLAVKHRA